MSSGTPVSHPDCDVLVYEAPGGEVRVDVRLDRETVWLTQRQMAEVFRTSTDNVGLHLKNIFFQTTSWRNRQLPRISRWFKPRASAGSDAPSSTTTWTRSFPSATGLVRSGAYASANGPPAFGEPLYRSREEKAANLLYFIVKDHPFTDGNKRIGSLLFLLYLKQEGVEHGLGPRALTALTLLIAESAPAAKDLMIRLVVNLLAEPAGWAAYPNPRSACPAPRPASPNPPSRTPPSAGSRSTSALSWRTGASAASTSGTDIRLR